MDSIDVIYCAKNRLGFTIPTFTQLVATLADADYRRLIVYDDGSDDGTAEFLRAACQSVAKAELREGSFGGPVAIMAEYLSGSEAEAFAKVDNDISCPPGWLGELAWTMDRYSEFDLLGMGGGWGGFPGGNPVYKYEVAHHIGGVGLMRTAAWQGRPPLEPNGRFGFTEWQWKYGALSAWITPGLLASELDRMPCGRWPALSAIYQEAGWQRDWGKYPPDHARWWAWWAEEAERMPTADDVAQEEHWRALHDLGLTS